VTFGADYRKCRGEAKACEEVGLQVLPRSTATSLNTLFGGAAKYRLTLSILRQ